MTGHSGTTYATGKLCPRNRFVASRKEVLRESAAHAVRCTAEYGWTALILQQEDSCLSLSLPTCGLQVKVCLVLELNRRHVNHVLRH
ncbi:hypothetical protein QQG55_27950 [Brugia pahangi]